MDAISNMVNVCMVENANIIHRNTRQPVQYDHRTVPHKLIESIVKVFNHI